jgi:GntR family transcriptional regulator / MocR family aminotransferase
MTNSRRKEWATSGIDLFLDFSRAAGPRLRARIENGFREAIRTGRLRRGTQLPPTRALAQDLGVSRGTLLEVYAQLAAEGWIAGRRGSSTVVAFDADPPRGATPIRAPSLVRWRFDLRPGRPDPSSFPRMEWLRALRRALASAPNEAFGYGSPQGQVSLRIELAGYLSRARGLHAVPDDLLITTGFTQGLGLVARSLAARGIRRTAMEEPSMHLHRSIVRAAGHELVLIPVDSDGMRVEQLEHGDGVGMVVLTPNRQHPTGATLSAPRRSRLLAWARATGTLIVEDDYDGEFRYDRRPIGPLQGLDPGVVVYGGTASKTLAPGVRIGWLVLPESIRQDGILQKELADWHNSTLEQLAFAEMLRTGAYDRHIRRMRLRYRRRRDTVILALTTNHPTLVVKGTEAGLNLLIPAPDASAEAAAIAAASAAGIGLDGLILGGYYESPGPAGLLVGYGATPQHAFRASVEALILALSDVVSDWPLLAKQT